MTSAPPPAPFYCVDTSSFTELRRTYPRALFEAVWKLIEKLAAEGRLISVEDVLIELNSQDDDVAKWAKSHQAIFIDLSEDIQRKARDVLASHRTLVDLKKKKSSADPFVIATAMIRGATVVTQEKKSGGPPTVKIPNVCEAYGIPCINLLQLLEAEKLRT